MTYARMESMPQRASFCFAALFSLLFGCHHASDAGLDADTDPSHQGDGSAEVSDAQAGDGDHGDGDSVRSDAGMGADAGDAGPTNLFPPSVPGGLRISQEDACSMATLAWDMATPNPQGSPLHGYRVYVNGRHQFTTLDTSQDLTLNSFNFADGISYSLTVAAFADDGDVSAQSQPLVYAPALCEHAPAPPTDVQGRATSCRAVALSWTAATQAGPNESVSGYIVHRDGIYLGEVPDPAFEDYGVDAASTHTYVVQTRSNQAIVSSPQTLQVTTPACTDTEPPSKPGNLKVRQWGDLCMDQYIDWSASSDNERVHHYNVYRDGVVIDRPSTPGDNADMFIAPLVRYKIEVSALDESGNESERSDPVTLEIDCSRPSQTSFRTALLLANFPDATDEPIALDEARDRVFGPTHSFASYMDEATYGVLDFHVGEAYGWYTLPKPVGNYCPGPGYIDCAGQGEDLMAMAKGDLGSTTYDRFMRIYEGIGVAGTGGGEGVDIRYGDFDIGSMTHEIGHTLGLMHAGLLECGGGELTAPNLLDLQEGGCRPGRYTDGFDVMGSGNEGHYSTFNKELLGALPAKQVAIAEHSGSYELEVVETPGSGIKELRIPLEHNGFFYFLEYRKPLGFDAPGAADGVQVRLHIGVLGQTGPLDAPNQRIDVLINPGQPFYDRYRKIKVEATAKTDTTITLKVTR